MKRDNTRCILTDMSEDSLINERFVEELDRVERWCRKTSSNIVEAPNMVKESFVNAGANREGYSKNYVKVDNVGFIPWTSPMTGDTWASIIRKGKISGLAASHIYFWNTIGSAGYMDRGYVTSPNGLCFRVINCVTSHAMYRYRDRMGHSDLSPFETILWLKTRVDNMAFKLESIEENKWKLYMICEDGAFISTDSNPSTEKVMFPVFRFRTYLPFKNMSKSKAKELSDYLEMVRSYQGISL